MRLRLPVRRGRSLSVDGGVGVARRTETCRPSADEAQE